MTVGAYVSVVGRTLTCMELRDPGVYEVTTETSVYLIDTVGLRALRTPRPGAPVVGQALAAGEPVHKQLFTDRAAIVLDEVPEPVVGLPLRMRIRVANDFLDAGSQDGPVDMVSTRVRSVVLLQPHEGLE